MPGKVVSGTFQSKKKDWVGYGTMARAAGRMLARARAKAERLRQRADNIGALGAGGARRERRQTSKKESDAGSKVINTRLAVCSVAVSVMPYRAVGNVVC